jgi:hypothetical protein
MDFGPWTVSHRRFLLIYGRWPTLDFWRVVVGDFPRARIQIRRVARRCNFECDSLRYRGFDTLLIPVAKRSFFSRGWMGSDYSFCNGTPLSRATTFIFVYSNVTLVDCAA